MTSSFSNFAARLRAFIEFSAKESDVARGNTESATGALGAVFNDLALELFALQFRANAPYRRFCESRGADPGSIVHWKKIPAVPTTAFKEFELTSLAPNERTNVFHSSGTTERRPSRHFHNADSLSVYEALLWSWFRMHVLGDELSADSVGSRPQLAVLTPPLAEMPHSSLVHMFDCVRRQMRVSDNAFLGRLANDGAWTLDIESSVTQLNSGDRLLLLGTAFSFVHLLDALAERKLVFKLPADSRVMETGGYKGRSRILPKRELHALITKRLGINPSDIICEYGMSELSSQAYDNGRDAKHDPHDVAAVAPYGARATSQLPRTFHFPPWVRAQIVSPETGLDVSDNETGLIRVFDLANVFSVLAVQTEDLAVRRRDGFELIGRAEFAEPRGCSLMVG